MQARPTEHQRAVIASRAKQSASGCALRWRLRARPRALGRGVAPLSTRNRGFAPAIHVVLCSAFFARASQDVDGRPSPAMTTGAKPRRKGRCGIRNDRVALPTRCGILLASVVLAGCTPACSIRKARSARPRGPILINSLAIMLAIVVPTIVATLGFAWWFRASQHQGALSAGLGLFRPHRAGRLGDPGAGRSCFWAASPGSARMISIPASRCHRTDAPLEVQVVSLDWKWLFIYPEPGRRDRQPARRPGRRAGALLADLGERA